MKRKIDANTGWGDVYYTLLFWPNRNNTEVLTPNDVQI